MKFLLFADLHYAPGVLPVDFSHLEIMQKRAEKENCDFIIHAGDITFDAGADRAFIEAYNNFHIPSYHVMGNHDTDHNTLQETLDILGMPHHYYYFDCKGYRIIALDPNYYYFEGQYTHYENRNYYKFGPYRDWMPPEQLLWLEETIKTSPYPCLLIAHESFEREADGVKNQLEVRRIINEANRRKPGSVLMCMNGHYHRDFVRILDNVCYMDVNSGTYEMVPKGHDLYPEELRRANTGVRYAVLYDERPVYAIVTVEGSTITVEGTGGGLYMGITREMTGNDRFDPAGRETTGNINSFRITLN